jgi:hypothetical protein
MKKIYTLFAFLIAPLFVFSQAKPKYPIELPVYNMGSIASYTIRATVLESNAYQYTISKVGAPEKKREFTLRPNNFEDFKENVTKAFASLISEDTSKAEKDTLNKKMAEFGVDNTYRLIFFRFVASEVAIDSHDFRPVAGELFFGKEVIIIRADRINQKVKTRLHEAVQKSGDEVSTLIDDKNGLLKMKEKLDEIKKNVDMKKDEAEKNILEPKIKVLDSSINALLEKLTSSDAATKKTEIQNDYKKAYDLYQQINDIILKSAGSDPIRVTYNPTNSNYTISTDLATYPPQQEHSAKKTLKRLYTDPGSDTPIGSGEIKNIEIEFNEGYIENIKVIVDYDGTILKFENNYPIGFSTKRDYNLLQKINLFANKEDQTYSIYLREVLERFEQKHEVDRRDYSPANQVVTFDVEKETRSSIQLAKETTAKLFELKTYSDFVGFDQNNPNGLIQLEVDKRLNLRTQRWRIPFSARSTLSYGQFVTPVVTKSKLEENNKHLILDYRDQFTNGQYTPQRFTSTLKLKQFENFRVGADLNLLMLDFPSHKSTYYINAGFRYGRVAVRDSLRTFENNTIRKTLLVEEYGVDTYTISPVKLLWEVKTDERYSFCLGWSLNLLFLRDNSFVQVANIPTYNDPVNKPGKHRYVYQNVLILASLKLQPESTGRLFFRYQYNWQQGYWRTGFHQAQVGYSVSLTKELKSN